MDYPPLYDELQDAGSAAAELRRNRSTLSIVGTGVVAIGLWSIAKTLLLFLNPQVEVLIRSIENGQSVVITTFVLLGFDLMLRLYVCLSARSQKRDPSRGILFLAVTALLIAMSALSVVLELLSVTPDVFSTIATGATVAIELTCILAMAQMMAAALRIRKLCRQES